VDPTYALFNAVSKADWAYKKVFEFHQSVNAWAATQPYAYVVDDNIDTGFKEHKFRLVNPAPQEIVMRAGDAVHQLRSSLDLMLTGIAAAEDKGVAGIGFPFGNDLDDFEAEMEKRKIRRKLGPLAVDLLRSFKPYHGGDELLYTLNKLDNTHKHRTLVRAAGTLIRGGIDFKSNGTGYWEMPNEGWKNDEIVFLRVTGDENIEMKMQLIPQVFFEGIDSSKDEPAFVVMLQILERVKEIINAFGFAYAPY
jgi:hypothetical protein